MLWNLLSGAYLFDKNNTLGWFKDTWTKWGWWILSALLVLFVLIAIIMFFKAISRTRQRKVQKRIDKEVAAATKGKGKVERVVTGISLDSTVVQRDFLVGSDFNCDGLLVKATYNTEPVEETIADYKLVDSAALDKALSAKTAPSGVLVGRPDLSKAGKPTVRVAYGKQLAYYSISVTETPVVEEPKQEEHPVAAVVAEVEEKPAESVRELTGITLDVGVVERDFKVGDEFNCDGLLVHATYNLAPLQETLANFAIVDAALFDKAVSGQMNGLYVCRPELTKSGKIAVRVCYNKQLALYTISVTERPVEQQKQPEPQPQPVYQPFVAPIQEQQVGPREMISLTVNTDYVRRDFYVGDTLTYDGLMVFAHYNREPVKEQVYNFSVVAPDMSRVGNPTVVVMFQGRAITYPIVVRENPYAHMQQQQQPQQPYVQPQQPVVQKERVLTRVSVNSDFAKKDYVVGEQFSREGLIVMAHYNVEPLQEQVANFTVIPPDMSRVGLATVMVAYQDRMVSYQVNVRPAPVVAKPEPVVVAEQPKAVRELVNVTLDTGVVQREFELGEQFNCEGLLINAVYSLAPTLETYSDYSVVDMATFDQLIKQADGRFVCEPDMNSAGRKVVRVSMNKRIAIYTIVVNKPKKVEPEVEQVKPLPEPQVIYVDKEVPVTVEPERSMLYITLATDEVKKTYTVGEHFSHEGLYVRAHFNKEPYIEVVEDFTVQAPDMNVIGRAYVSVIYKDKAAGYQIVVKDAPAVDEQPEQQPETQPAVAPQPTVVVQQATPIVVEEESYEGRQRYDRSFNARVIQSDDKTKAWYTDVKNELLSYKKVHNRISWKRETFKCAKNVVAKLAFRGNTLVLLLPLNAADYADSKYALEDVSDTPSNADTPAMFRIKSDKRVKQAIDLIEEVMGDFNIDKDRKYQPEDFYVPYEGVFELIKKGLIKREIKTAQDEAVFTGGKSEDDDDAYELEEVAPGVFVSPKK